MKIILRILTGMSIIVIVFVLYVLFSWDKQFDAPYPDLKASTDSATIARGKYLAFGPAHCSVCHVPMDKVMAVDAGMEMPLIGGWEMPIPPGTFRAPNLTSDKETGIGNRSDAEIARTMRYMVHHDGRLVFPFMPFQQMSDEDVIAIISFLRAQEPVNNEVPQSDYSFLGKALIALGAIKAEGPKSDPPVSFVRDTTVLYGSYIANSVANCVGCHTARDLKTGEFIGEPFAGGFYMAPDELSKGYAFVTPNLTPDPETGSMAQWSEEMFVNRFRFGRINEGSHMPWGTFSRMDDLDLRAVYRYLKSLEPVNNKIEKIVFAPGEI